MSYTLHDLLLDVYGELGMLQVKAATGGATTYATVSDMAQIGIKDSYKNGCLFVVKDSAGLGAAPEGEFNRITEYDHITGKFTTSAFTAAIATGDEVGFTRPNPWPLLDMIQITNRALKKLGDLTLVDTTTLDTVAEQTEYEQSLTWKHRSPIRIDIQGKTTDSDDNQWERMYEGTWEVVPATAGSTGLIVFRDQPLAERGLRIWYRDRHPWVDEASDVIAETIHPSVAKYAVIEAAVMQAYNREQTDEWREKMNFYTNEYINARRQNPIQKFGRKGKIFQSW